MNKRKNISSTFWMRKELMSNPKDIVVKLRLLVKPPINVNNFFYKVTYTKFGYQNQDGSHVSPKTIAGKFVKFTANSSANKNGLLAIESEDIVLLDHKRSIQKVSLPDAKNGSAWFQIENRSNGKVVRKNKYPQWSYRHKREISEYKWDTTSSKNSTTPNTKKTQKIKQKCPHTVDGAIEVAKYIVDEIKRNVKSKQANEIRSSLKEYKRRLFKNTVLDDPFLILALSAWVEQVDNEKAWDHKTLISGQRYQNLKAGEFFLGNPPKAKLNNLTVHRPISYRVNAKESHSHFHKYKDYDYFYDIWSNIHYGYVGLSVGFDENTLLAGSDFQQFLHNAKKGTWGADTPDDRTTMKMGFILFKKFGKYADNLTFQDVLNILDNTSINSFPESKQTHWCYNSHNPNKVENK